jgi:metallo-beta-lactamase family protein
MLPNSKHTVLFVGYQALGTRGRSLVDGAETVKMHGELVPVRARVEQIAEFSVHADSTELIDWLSSTSVAPGQVFVVHGEAGAAEAFSDSIESKLGWKSMAPKDGQQVNL